MNKNEILADLLGDKGQDRPNWIMRQLNKLAVMRILNDEKSHMDDVSKTVAAYNRFAAKNSKGKYDGTKLDEFYHKRAMYRAAQLGPDAAEYALWLGKKKEDWYDWPRNKYLRKYSDQKNEAEREKDLQNNRGAVIMSLQNPGVPVNEMIPHEGTTAGTFDIRFLRK